MIIVTVSFNYPPEYNLADYEMLARVFRHSCSKYCPEAKFLDIKVDPPILPDGDRHALNFLYNTIKLEEWLRIIEETDENIILADADMVAIRPFSESEIFDQEFDVGYTERTEVRLRKDKNTRQYWGDVKIRRMPMNGGIMFVKSTEPARDFFRQYKEVNQRLYDNGYEHQKWRVKYAGMNQAAFGCLFETGQYEAIVKSFPCRIWNAVDTDWPHILRCGTVFVHMKSRLRRLVLGQKLPFGNYKAAMQSWYAEAGEIGAPVYEDSHSSL
jgi:hypothetical protein